MQPRKQTVAGCATGLIIQALTKDRYSKCVVFRTTIRGKSASYFVNTYLEYCLHRFSEHVLTLLLTVTAHLSITCPSQCQSCASGRVRCPGVGLTKVPSAFPQDTISVDLTQNNIQELDALPSLADLQSFRISMNKLDVIKGGVFENTPNLMSLDLSMNTIKKVYKHGFKELSQLMTISLNGNQLKEVALIFQNTPMITSVRLGNNEIAEIDDEAFKNNTMIKMIDLSNNQISRIHSNCLQKS
ncbi:hypothetical protein DPMN_130620 [Dreissena polymorpha]|uniref:LRRNT domain-containing protein n=1 Tax=Dreissena polymorpha TaxID=45954 RepID=A0A9D4H4X0_DREPO|nr:hypothetical protein DPMN_130620 [Dreissena polymorpha]